MCDNSNYCTISTSVLSGINPNCFNATNRRPRKEQRSVVAMVFTYSKTGDHDIANVLNLVKDH